MMHEGDSSAFTRALYGCEPDDIAEVVLLTPMENTFEALKDKGEDVEKMSGFFQGFNAQLGGKYVSIFNSKIGSPVASDCVYYLRFTPCRSIIYTGLIGALQSHIAIGDLIVPTAAYRGDGASRYFVEEAYPAVADFSLLLKLNYVPEEIYKDCEIEVHYGPIFTTDSFAAETKNYLGFWQSKNLLGIEMETSAIYTVASLYGIRAVAVHVVSDNPVAGRSFFHKIPEEDSKRRHMSEGMLMDVLVKLVTSI
jgi:uridine phosphorylase